MIYVKVRRGQSIDKALGVLEKKVKETKLMLELREREFYTKPSVIKKEKKAKAKLRNKRNAFSWFFQSLYIYIYKKYTTASCHLVV